MPDYTGGFTGGINTLSEVQSRAVLDAVRQQEMQARAMQMQRQQQLLQARGPAFDMLAKTMGGPPQGIPPPPMLAPPPGTPQGGPQPMPPGTPSMPPAPQPAPALSPPGGAGGMPPPPGAPMAGPPPMAAPPMPPPPFRAMPTAPPQAGAAGMVPPPPAMPGAPPVPQQDTTPRWQGNIGQVIQNLDKMGVPSSVKMDMLDEMRPILNEQQQHELQFYKAQTQALKTTEQFYKDQLLLNLRQQEVDVKKGESARKTEQGDKRIELSRESVDIRRRAAEAKVTAKYGNTGAKQELTPEGMKLAAELVRSGVPLPGGWSKSGMARGNAILNEMARDEEGGAGSGAVVASRVGFKADEASLRQMTGRANAIEQSSKKINNDMATLDKFLDSGTAGSVKLINKPINKIREQFSSPELTELTLAAQIVGTEYERMINGGLLSVAQLHEGAREDAHKLLNADMTPTQMQRTMKLMRSEIDNQRKAFKDQISEQRGTIGRPSPATPGGGDRKQEAMDAIAKGAPPDAVKKRYKELTGQDF